MNKWRRDPISSWQSFWNRGQLISRMSQQNSLFSLLRAWHGCLLLSCHQLGGRHPGKAAASVQLHLTASSCTLPYLYIFVFVKKRLAFANIFMFQPSHPSSSSSPGNIQPWGIQPKRNGSILVCFSSYIHIFFFFRICISTEEQK